MKEYDATEQAYKNGYRQAVEDFEKSQKTEANSVEKSNGMTEAEIMKALECCKMPVGSGACNHCPLNETREKRLTKEDKSCTSIMLEDALDLINRKNAENERLEKEVDRLSQVVLYHDGEIADAQAEAIKEFAERVKAKAIQKFDWNEYVEVEDIDQIAKEMGVEL